MLKIRKGVAMLLIAAMICGMNPHYNVNAAEEDNTLQWEMHDISLEHKSISFTISDVEAAQTATVVVADRDSDEVVCEKSFSIRSSSQKINVEITDGYIKSGSYYVYATNSSGEKTEKCYASMADHSKTFWMSGDAYPNCFVGELSLYGSKDKDVKFTASVGFQEYAGSIDEEGNAKLEYPQQEAGTIIKFKVCDAYGCEYTFEKSVTDVNFTRKSFNAWHTGISMNGFDQLSKTQRVCARVDGKVYYSEYGAASGEDATMIVRYPSTNTDCVAYWYESIYGSKSEEKTLNIKSCDLKECEYSVNAYQFKALGTVKANLLGQKPVKVKVTIDGQEYSADIAADGTFSLSYPSQKNYTNVTFVFVDEHGCTVEYKKQVFNSLESDSPSISEACVLPTNATMDEAKKGVRLVAQIGNDKYYGEYGGRTVSYPFCAPGTAISFWLEADNSGISKVQNAKVFSGEYMVKINARTGSATGDIYSEEYASEYNSTITSAYVEIAGKKYDCKLVMKKGSEDAWRDQETYYHFSVKYPIQKVGTSLTFYFTDANQITVSKQVKLSNIAPKIRLNKVDSSTKKLIGTTTAKSDITVNVGKKKYKGKANANGQFSIKIKEQKKGTKIKVLVVTPEGYTNHYVTKIKQSTGTLLIAKYVYRTSNSVKLRLTNAKKGDKITVKAGAKTYIKKITSNKMTQNVTVKMQKQSAGKSIKVTLYDKFSKKKDSETTMVYYGDTIYKGMSAKNAQLTTWGSPVRKNDYGWGTVQWVYESGKTTMYVYIKGGKVVDIQRFNY